MPFGMLSAVYVATSGLVARSLATSRSPPGAKILTVTSSSVLAIAATATICLVLASVSSNSCFGPHSDAVTSPWNG